MRHGLGVHRAAGTDTVGAHPVQGTGSGNGERRMDEVRATDRSRAIRREQRIDELEAAVATLTAQVQRLSTGPGLAPEDGPHPIDATAPAAALGGPAPAATDPITPAR